MTDSDTTETNESAIIKVTAVPKVDLISDGNNNGSVSFDESNILLLKKYRDWEESLKLEYYKSNPLRNYVSSIYGKSILPCKSTNCNKKKSLPKIFNELRTTENIQQDRGLHRKKLCTSLNITLDSLDILNKKNPIDLLEESKKIYSEYCKYNLTKPIDLTNVESILKTNLRKSDTNSSHQNSNSNDFDDSASLSSRSSLNSDDSSSIQTNDKKNIEIKEDILNDTEWDSLSNLNINAKPAKLTDLTEIDNDIKEHKKKLAQSNQDAVRMKHNYRTIVSGKASRHNEKLQQLKPSYYQHRGSIYNYRNRNRIGNQMVEKADDDFNTTNANNNFNNKASLAKSQIIPPNSADYIIDERENTVTLNVPRVSVNNLSCFGTEFYCESAEHMKTFKSNIYNENINNPIILNQYEKKMKRVQNARDKILNETIEKTNLNKMTILQPFEDTKILINIDKVSSKILNSLLNKHNTVPRYYMPPIKSFGYFKKVITNDPSSLINTNLSSNTYPATANLNQAHMYSDHLNKQHHLNRLESLKSLSEQASKAPTFYFDDEIDTNKYNEASVMSQLNDNSAKKSEASLRSLDGRADSSKGVST